MAHLSRKHKALSVSKLREAEAWIKDRTASEMGGREELATIIQGTRSEPGGCAVMVESQYICKIYCGSMIQYKGHQREKIIIRCPVDIRQ